MLCVLHLILHLVMWGTSATASITISLNGVIQLVCCDSVGNVEASGLQADCPLREGEEMSAEAAAAVDDEVCGILSY